MTNLEPTDAERATAREFLATWEAKYADNPPVGRSVRDVVALAYMGKNIANASNGTDPRGVSHAWAMYDAAVRDDIAMVAGALVRHDRWGYGQVLKVEQTGYGTEAHIRFNNEVVWVVMGDRDMRVFTTQEAEAIHNGWDEFDGPVR